MMKERYQEPVMDVVEILGEDVITTSATEENGGIQLPEMPLP